MQAIFDLACHTAEGPVKIAEVSRRQHIPQKFLESILAGLKQGGFVESRRGVDGGYMLARRAETITVGEVLRYVEGPRDEARGAKRKPATPFTEMWREVDDAVSQVIDHTTFAELARVWTERRSHYVPDWAI